MTQREMMIYDQMVEWMIATPEELNLARNLVAGEWEEVLNSVLFIRTGYRNWEQFIEAQMEEDEEEEIPLTDEELYDLWHELFS